VNPRSRHLVASLALCTAGASGCRDAGAAKGPGAAGAATAGAATAGAGAASAAAAEEVGDDAGVWRGKAGDSPWTWTSLFAHPRHVALVRARFGDSPTSGVPTALRWEALRPADGSAGGSADCPATPEEGGWTPLLDRAAAGEAARLAQPTRLSWFVDADACGLRLIVDRTNDGPPVVRSVQAIEGARDVLRGARASDDGAYPGFGAAAVVDGTYAGRWAGAPGRKQWSLRVDLDEPAPIDRIGLTLGFEATSVARKGAGRGYAIAWGPVRYVLQVSEDGRTFDDVATEPTRSDGTPLPVRRRVVRLGPPRDVRAIRLQMTGATGADGLPHASAVPVVRELAAYRADDGRPELLPPWILSINANPSGQSHTTPGGEVCNDAYHAKFLQARFRPLLPALARDDRFARSLGPRGEPLDAPPSAEAGQVLESIEGDDPLLDAHWLLLNDPLPISVLGGSNDWDYAARTGPDAARPKRWHWNPLDDATGVGRLSDLVRQRAAPFLGFCGGAQLLAVLEARGETSGADDDFKLVDSLLRRNDGHAIRGFGSPADLVRSWPGDSSPRRTTVRFAPDEPLFSDVAALDGRSATRELPELHTDAVRPDAFAPGGPLERFRIIASSAFCGPGVVAAGLGDGVFPAVDPGTTAWCNAVPEAFVSRDGRWPIIGVQFHAEQRDFARPAVGDPPASVSDPFLFFAAAYEAVVDALASELRTGRAPARTQAPPPRSAADH
jgi:hypothetical protein